MHAATIDDAIDRKKAVDILEKCGLWSLKALIRVKSEKWKTPYDWKTRKLFLWLNMRLINIVRILRCFDSKIVYSYSSIYVSLETRMSNVKSHMTSHIYGKSSKSLIEKYAQNSLSTIICRIVGWPDRVFITTTKHRTIMNFHRNPVDNILL